MSTIKLCLLFLAAILLCCETYKILVVFPMPSKSHGILGDGVVRHLLNDGHEIKMNSLRLFNSKVCLFMKCFQAITTESFIMKFCMQRVCEMLPQPQDEVTYISVFPYRKAHPKLRRIDISDNEKVLQEHTLSVEAIMNKTLRMDDHALIIYMSVTIMNETLTNENVRKIIYDPNEQFDAVITEWMFSELLAGFAAIFDCPHIWLSSMEVHWLIQRLIDQPSNPAYTVNCMSTYMPPLTFLQRISELYTQLRVQFLRYTFFDNLEKQAYDNLIAPIVVKRGRQPPSYYDLQYNASLVLANSHVSVGLAVPLPQNYVAVAGYHIEETVKPLPVDLQKLMDSAKNGVIYFSMGSNLKSKDIPKDIIDSLLKMFGELKQTVLWKFEEALPHAPKNVHILKWAPQQSILAHPNIVVFITHGGLLSTTETIHYGVPIIGIPVFGDQFINVIRSTKRGFALKVDLSYTMASELKTAIEEVISNPKYAEKAKELSFIYHNRPIPPGKELAHWVNHVIDTKGAPHLRSPAIDVPFYQRLYLDLLVIILIILIVIKKLLENVYKFVLSKKNTEFLHVNKKTK